MAAGIQLGAVACSKQAPVPADASIAALDVAVDALTADAGDAGDVDASDDGPGDAAALLDGSDAAARASARARTSPNPAVLQQLVAEDVFRNAICGAPARNDMPPVDLNQLDGPVAHTGGLGGLNLGQPKAPAPPPDVDGNVAVGGLSFGSGSVIPNAASVVAGLRSRFHACYRTALKTDPTQQGLLVVTVKVAPNGEVDSTNLAQPTDLAQPLVACVMRALRNAQLEAPGTGGAVMTVPLKFARK